MKVRVQVEDCKRCERQYGPVCYQKPAEQIDHYFDQTNVYVLGNGSCCCCCCCSNRGTLVTREIVHHQHIVNQNNQFCCLEEEQHDYYQRTQRWCLF